MIRMNSKSACICKLNVKIEDIFEVLRTRVSDEELNDICDYYDLSKESGIPNKRRKKKESQVIKGTTKSSTISKVPRFQIGENGSLVKNNTITKSKSEYKELQELKTSIINRQSMPQFINSSKFGKYPKSCDYRCKYCTLYFDTMPLLMPTKIGSDGTLYGIPAYCSFQCILAEINRYHKEEKTKYIEMMYYEIDLIKQIDTKNELNIPEDIKPADDYRICLQYYGGPMTEDEYKIMLQDTSIRWIAEPKSFVSEIPKVISINVDYSSKLEKQHKRSTTSINNLGQIVKGTAHKKKNKNKFIKVLE